jgi:phage terminase large subunit GpA-like protein
VNIYRRNEALDCWVMARAAAFLVMRHDQFTEADWQTLEAPRGIAPPPSKVMPPPAPSMSPLAESVRDARTPTVVPPPGGTTRPVTWRRSTYWPGRPARWDRNDR